MKDPTDETPVMYGLNSRLVKRNGKIFERIWKSGGLYGTAIDKIVSWLEKAKEVTDTAEQATVIDTLIAFYRTGDLKTFDTYAKLAAMNDRSSFRVTLFPQATLNTPPAASEASVRAARRLARTTLETQRDRKSVV